MFQISRRLFRRLLIPLNGFKRSKKVINSGGIRSYSASHAGNTGSNPVGITTNNFKDLEEILYPFLLGKKLIPNHLPNKEENNGIKKNIRPY